MSHVRVAVVQITTHPSFTIGERDYASEPFLVEHEPILSRLSRSMDVLAIRQECLRAYEAFHNQRLDSILNWIKAKWTESFESNTPAEQDGDTTDSNQCDISAESDREPTHIVVFPEGAISRKQLERIQTFVNDLAKSGKYVVVIAGTHSFHNSRRAFDEYPGQKDSHSIRYSGEETSKGQKPNAFLAPKRHAFVTKNNLCCVDKQEEFRRLEQSNVYEAKSVLPIIHYDGSISLRLKMQLSPFEYTNTAFVGVPSDPPPRIVVTFPDDAVPLEQSSDQSTIKCGDSTGKRKPKIPVSLRILPLVCSEALHAPKEIARANIVAICGYHDKPRQYDTVIQQATQIGELVISVNDGRFGGSGVFLVPDNRAENWWFGKGNEGKLPPGDAILLADLNLNQLLPEKVRFNPRSPGGVTSIAAIVPEDVRDRTFLISEKLKRVSDELNDFETVSNQPNSETDAPKANERSSSPEDAIDCSPIDCRAGADYEKIKRLLIPMADDPDATPIQAVKINRLIKLAQRGNISRATANALCDDCRIQKPTAESNNLQSILLSLDELERHLCWLTLQHIEHEASMEPSREAGREDEPSEISEVKKLINQKRRLHGVTRPGEALQREINLLTQEGRRKAEGNLVRELGEIVEDFGATSGWIFLVREDPHGSVEKSNAANSGQTKKVFFPVVAYNTPDLRIHRNVGTENSGVVGYVAATGMPILSPDIAKLDGSDAKHPRYIGDVKSTRSELAIPLFWGEGSDRKVIGVLNLEANYYDAFMAIDIQDLFAASAILLPDLLVVEHSYNEQSTVAWHPDAHGWKFPPLLNRVCNAIACSLPTQHGNPSIGCAIWYHDRTKRLIYVRGAARFDFEYQANRILRVDETHIGRAILECESANGLRAFENWRTPKGNAESVKYDGKTGPKIIDKHMLIADSPAFKRKIKAKRMELRSVAAFPFIFDCSQQYLEPSSETQANDKQLPQTQLTGALAIYGFEHDSSLGGVSVLQMFNEAVGHSLAARIGDMIQGIVELRAKVAKAYLLARLQSDATAARNPLETLKQVLQEILGAHGCTIFGRIKGNREDLVVLATTGLIPAHMEDKARELTYPLTEMPEDKCEIDFEPSTSNHASDVKKYEVRTGLTKYLGQMPGTALRKIDAVDVQEPVFTTVEQEEAKYFGPRKLLIESFAPGASEHMRFLGISIKGKNGEFVNDSVGVIRLTRTGSAAPFSEADEVLLRMLGEVARPFFEHEASRRPQVANNNYEIEDLVTRLTLRPPQSIPAFPGRARIAAVLEDLNDLCQEIYRRFQKTKLGDKAKSGESSGDFKNPVVLSSIRFVVEHVSPISVGLREPFLHVHTMQPTWSSETASEDDGEGLPHPEHLDANGWKAIGKMRPLTFACDRDPSKNDQRFHKVHSLTKWVRSGCCYPFVVHQDNMPIKGILSIDFACSEIQINKLWETDLLPAIRLAVTKVKWLFENGAQHLPTEQLTNPGHLARWDDEEARNAWENRLSEEHRFQAPKSSEGEEPNMTLWGSHEIDQTREVALEAVSKP